MARPQPVGRRSRFADDSQDCHQDFDLPIRPTAGLAPLACAFHLDRVAMFHRVLPRGGPRWEQAEPAYTISDRVFVECLEFFRRYYTVVSLDDVLAARQGLRPLPPRALLITFDDGWLDNLEVALPPLQRAGLPAGVFAATEPLADPASSCGRHLGPLPGAKAGQP